MGINIGPYIYDRYKHRQVQIVNLGHHRNCYTAMSKNSPKTQENSQQPSILNFVDKPTNGSGSNRLSRPTKKFITQKATPRGSSSSSTSRKHKLSAVDHAGNTPKVEKIIIMEPQNENITPSPHPKHEDPFAKALKEMEERLTQKMKEMIDPLTTSLNSLVSQQKDWEQQ